MGNRETIRPRDESKLYASLAALAFGSIAIIVMAWFATQIFATRMANLEAERRATAWSARAINSMQMGKPSFDQATLSPADKARLHDLLMASDIYRYVLYTADGTAFWSSKLSRIGSKAEGDYFAGAVAKGDVYVKPDVKKASEIDGLLWRKGTLGVDPESERRVVEVYVPVMSTDRFVGAIEAYVDMTELIAFYERQARNAAVVLGTAFGVVFLLVAAMVYFYARERRSNIDALMQARDEALNAEGEARELAGELQRMNNDILDLNQELAQNMKKLTEAQDEIIRKGRMAQLGQLTATVAHEIRNPLGTVRTAAYLLGRKLKDADPSVTQTLRRIANGVVRCDNIITELLDFARSSAPQLSTLVVDDWVSKAVEEEAQGLPDAVAIECHLGLGATVAAFDPGRFQRMLANLLANASEAMVGKATEAMAPTVAHPRIVVTTRRSERGIEIEVADNGPGIAPENLQRILEPLFTTKNFGVGLGLPAVQKILEQHGGGLEVRSRPGEGATFTAWFPVAQEAKEAA